MLNLQDFFHNYVSFLPEIIIGIGLLASLMYNIFGKKNVILAQVLYIFFVLASLFSSFFVTKNGNNDMYIVFERLLLLSAALVPLFFSEQSKANPPEWLFLLLSNVLGLQIMMRAQDFVSIFVALELSAISFYILVIISWTKVSKEGALKYLLLGIFASAFMLYGLSWLYGFTGSLQLSAPKNLHFKNEFLLALAFLMFLSGFLMKISAFPWHIWAPDAYQVAPNSVVAFLSTAPKVSTILVLLKILMAYQETIPSIRNILIVIAIISITWGNLSAFWQKSTKRMLAYSAIANAGYLLIGVLVHSSFALQSLQFYLLVYVLSNFLAFLLLDFYEKKQQIYNIEDFKGLGERHALTMIAMLIAMISLAGLPPTAGFTAKLFIFSALWQNYQQSQSLWEIAWLFVGLLNTVIGLFYYLKIPYMAFLKKSAIPTEKKNTENTSVIIFAWLLAASILFLFFYPSVF
ncbi:MAG: NADH-quinone oxidoreductase subunit N [Thermonemataceae bacterium]|nr:NADH-quinone oxidoreductase subunit N [Thermonemataceae bacterium]